jgi:amyloid beta precursor protein binding protein 1
VPLDLVSFVHDVINTICHCSQFIVFSLQPPLSEVLKNLVLGGIASFCIIDNAKVTHRDLGNNFLVEHHRLGESRAKVVTELLQELNESVSGSYVEEDPSTLVSSSSAFFSNFTLVIATQV